MASSHKKQTESKYVTCFADSRPDVDITFRDVLLSRPTDHFLVGVDNLSMTNTSFGLLEPLQIGTETEVFLRIVHRPPHSTAPQTSNDPLDEADLETALTHGGAFDLTSVRVPNATATGYRFEVSTGETILTMQQLMHRLNEVAGDVSEYMNTSNFTGLFGQWTGGGNEQQLRFRIGSDGRLHIDATRSFWACFAIEVPTKHYQFALYGAPGSDPATDFTRSRRFLTKSPNTGVASFAMMQVLLEKKPNTSQQNLDHNQVVATGQTPKIFIVREQDAAAAAAYMIHSGPAATDRLEFVTKASIVSSMERRIALEVGCSLPIQNSPMVDHQKENSDFVLGRWIWRTDPRIESSYEGQDRRIGSVMPACTEYQGAQDRVCYHELRPQAKIQTLRIKIFARVRAFDPVLESYSMRILDLPTSQTDWWHLRLHFISKD